MRIAGLAFARLRGPNNTYALLLNKGRLKHNGERILSPIGGGLILYGSGQRLVLGLGAQFEGKATDMQFAVPDQNVPAVVNWFHTTAYREHSVLCETREELGDETGILSDAQLRDMSERFSHFARHDDTTKRPVADKRTAYLIDVFDLRVTEDAMRRLVAASERQVVNRWLYFVTRREIENGVTARGNVTIGPICKKLFQ